MINVNFEIEWYYLCIILILINYIIAGCIVRNFKEHYSTENKIENAFMFIISPIWVPLYVINWFLTLGIK